MTRYLLDANIFIEAKNRHYGFDFCPAFWDWLVMQNHAEKVASIEKVKSELYAKNDKLAIWAKNQRNGFFLEPDDAVTSKFGIVSNWANGSKCQSVATKIFLEAADSWLVAHALAYEYIVVTHEVFSESTSKIKIPNACKDIGLDCVNPYEMLRHEKARFILRPQKQVA